MDAPIGLPEQPPKKTCGQPTEHGLPCRLAPLAGADRCNRHAGLPPTPAEQEASRSAGLKNGYFAKGLLDHEQDRFHDYRRGLKDPAEVQRDFTAFTMVRAERVAAWEAGVGTPSGLAQAALDAANRALEKAPKPEHPDAHEVASEELARIVEELTAKPELFLKTLHPDVQAKVRPILREAGVIP